MLAYSMSQVNCAGCHVKWVARLRSRDMRYLDVGIPPVQLRQPE